MKTVLIEIDEKYHRKLKLFAVVENKSMAQIIRRLIERYVARKRTDINKQLKEEVNN